VAWKAWLPALCLEEEPAVQEEEEEEEEASMGGRKRRGERANGETYLVASDLGFWRGVLAHKPQRRSEDELCVGRKSGGKAMERQAAEAFGERGGIVRASGVRLRRGRW